MRAYLALLLRDDHRQHMLATAFLVLLFTVAGYGLWWALAFALGIGGLREIVQHYVPSQGAGEWSDVFANFVGAAIGAALTGYCHWALT